MDMQRYSQIILSQKDTLAEFVTEKQNQAYPKLSELSAELLPLRVELVTLYGEALSMDCEERKHVISEWGKQTGKKCAEMGTTLDSMLNEVPHYREIIGNELKKEAMRQEISLEDFYHILSRLDETVNEIVYYFSLPFVEFHETQILQSQSAVMELSVPVVPISKGIAVLPVIGTLDTYRAKLLLEQSLEKSVQLKVEHFVLDLSGVPIIDTFVAHQIFQIIDSLKLIGVNAAISGITPEIAQTIVGLNLNFGQIKTYSSLQYALQGIGFSHHS
ncbi:STAS domain-containing protein [Bacillus sp. FJAT-42376]|uniref:STAS domain-containing protein n=1 Tax=Bacillus sp. FJAT-42376 TaxID=2014076 RepID=UPI000F502A50|nr:STAS domain-containing protein [Bacillus sp. FJAT-42376]AZB43171.1 STAS domain-containing protein [Bacillus sp. FJAT-42376]